jgi:hypothetical protein
MGNKTSSLASPSERMDVDDDNKLMTVPNHFIPMQYPYQKTKFYVRDCYSEYYDIIHKDLFGKDDMISVLITGTPGIGKSIFYMYVYMRMKKERKDTVFVLASFSKEKQLISCVILAPGKEPDILDNTIQRVPFIENAIYLYDGTPNIVEQGLVKTVIFASPNHAFIKEHSKNPTMSKYYMPLWTEREIFEAAELLELGLDYDLIQKLFFRFGGSVQYILTTDIDFREEGLDHQDRAIGSIKSWADLKKYNPNFLDVKVDDKDIIHRVFYFVPDMGKTYMYEMRLGSIYIASAVEANLKNADEQERLKLYRWLQLIYERHLRSIYFAVNLKEVNLKEVDEQERLKLFRWLQSHDQTSGWLFENYCHGVLSSGINAVAILLTDGAHDLQLEMSPGYLRIAELESIEDMFRNMYSAPDIPNLPAVGYYIDTIKGMIYLFQMTVSRDHCISLENLTYVMKKFELNKHGLPFALIFVVPSNMVNDYPKQKITAAHSFDDLKNRSVDEIRGICPKTAMKLSSLNISSQQDFYTAARDEGRLKELMDIVKNKNCILKFVEIVDGIKQYKDLIDIPQFVLGINVERSMDMESFKRKKLSS